MEITFTQLDFFRFIVQIYIKEFIEISKLYKLIKILRPDFLLSALNRFDTSVLNDCL